MRKFYLASFFTSLFILLLGTGVRAQVSLEQDFEGTNTLTYVTDPATTYNVSNDVWDIVASVGSINPSATGGTMFWGGRDVDNPNGGMSGKNTLTFEVNDICDVTSPMFTFEYNVFEFDGGDDFGYTLVLDGVAEADVILVDGVNGGGASSAGWETASIPVPASTENVSLIIFADQDGAADYFGIDNVIFSGGGSLGGCLAACGITSLGPTATTICASTNNAPNTDTYAVSVNYAGMDAAAVVGLNVGGTPASSFDISNGNDPANDADGILVITSPDLIEGTSFEVTLTGGTCDLSVAGSVDANACEDECGITFAGLRIICETLSAADNTDMIIIEIDYNGVEPGASISGIGLTTSGDDPAVVPDGTVVLSGAVEGQTYFVSITGGSCTSSPVTFPVPVPSDICTPSALVINEVLADPGTTNPANDANGDGTLDSGQDEFIELFNTGTDPIDMTGIFVIETGANTPRYTFDAGFMLPGRTAFVIFGGGTASVPNCLSGIANGFLGLNNDSETVSVRNATGQTIAQMSYTSGPDDESLALNPDGDLASGYVAHTTIANPTGAPLTHSACLENDDPQFALPIELLRFTATAAAKSVTLDWATANEVANDRFVIERSQNASQWSPIGTVRAGGRSAADYAFTDEQPLDGRTFYRLRQIDLDGSFALYGPVQVVFTAAELSVFPNPAGNELRFNRQLEAATVTLLEGTGRTLRNVTVANGRLDVSSLRPGIYLIRVEQGNTVETLRFVKQ